MVGGMRADAVMGEQVSQRPEADDVVGGADEQPAVGGDGELVDVAAMPGQRVCRIGVRQPQFAVLWTNFAELDRAGGISREQPSLAAGERDDGASQPVAMTPGHLTCL